MPVRILAANQAPTLLNNLNQAPEWDIQVVYLEDRNAFSESRLGACPDWDGQPVDQFWACAGHHVERAQATFGPQVEIVYLIHDGLPEASRQHFRGRRVICMSEANAEAVRRVGGAKSAHVIQPAYEAKLVWEWLPDIAWTTMSRPQHRTLAHHALLARITEACAAVGGQHDIYGQDQPAGFLEGAKKRAFLEASSCYAAFSLPSGGFGLSEHEAMAAGVPVVAWAWGDMEKEAPNHPGLCFSPPGGRAQGRPLLHRPWLRRGGVGGGAGVHPEVADARPAVSQRPRVSRLSLGTG